MNFKNRLNLFPDKWFWSCTDPEKYPYPFLRWVVLELHGSEKRFPPSLEQHVNVSAVKTGSVFFCGCPTGVKVQGSKNEEWDEATIQVSPGF